MNSPTLRVGFFGLGLMGTRMAEAMREHHGFAITAGLDQDPGRTRTWCAKYGARPAESLEDLLGDESVDLLYIATPPSAHIAATRQALQCGKAVWLEKPLASDWDQAQELMADWRSGAFGAARAWMHFPFATMPGLASLRRRMAAGDLGQAQRVEISFQFSQWPRTWHHAGPWLAGPREGGFTREVASHFLYLTQTLCGPLQCWQSDVRRADDGTEAHLFATLDAGGVPVSITAGVAGGAPDHNRWTWFGERGAWRVEDWNQVMVGSPEGWQPYAAQPGESAGLSGSLDALRETWLSQNGEAVAHPGPLATLEDGWQVMQAVETMLHFEGEPN